MEKYLSIYDSDFKLCDEDSRISTDMETKSPFFEKRAIRNLQNLRNLRNLRAFQNSAKNLGEIRERNTQDGNNLRRNWFIGGCPINWRRPTLPHSHAVPSARTGLTALFGMGRGVPRGYNRHCLLKFLAYSTHINAL